MKPVRLVLALVAGLMAAGFASAATVPLPAGTTAIPLAVITNDRDASVSHMNLMLDAQSTVSGIYMQTSATADSDPSADESQVYPLAGIESQDGVVLGEGQGVKAIFLRGNIASADGRGALTIRYLTNGVFRHWAECRIDLQKLGPHRWQLVNAYDGRPVEKIKVETWALGISTLANVCPNTAA